MSEKADKTPQKLWRPSENYFRDADKWILSSLNREQWSTSFISNYNLLHESFNYSNRFFKTFLLLLNYSYLLLANLETKTAA